VLEGLVGHHGWVNSAEHHGLARAAEAVGDLVGAAGLDGHGGDANQIDIRIVESNAVTQVLLDDRDFVFRWSNGRQELERGALNLSPT